MVLIMNIYIYEYVIKDIYNTIIIYNIIIYSKIGVTEKERERKCQNPYLNTHIHKVPLYLHILNRIVN